MSADPLARHDASGATPRAEHHLPRRRTASPPRRSRSFRSTSWATTSAICTTAATPSGGDPLSFDFISDLGLSLTLVRDGAGRPRVVRRLVADVLPAKIVLAILTMCGARIPD